MLICQCYYKYMNNNLFDDKIKSLVVHFLITQIHNIQKSIVSIFLDFSIKYLQGYLILKILTIKVKTSIIRYCSIRQFL